MQVRFFLVFGNFFSLAFFADRLRPLFLKSKKPLFRWGFWTYFFTGSCFCTILCFYRSIFYFLGFFCENLEKYKSQKKHDLDLLKGCFFFLWKNKNALFFCENTSNLIFLFHSYRFCIFHRKGIEKTKMAFFQFLQGDFSLNLAFLWIFRYFFVLIAKEKSYDFYNINYLSTKNW